MTQVLTLKHVKAAARKAYKARRLTAQHRVRKQRRCVYQAGCYHCVIGAALNKATIKALMDLGKNNIGIESLIENKKLNVVVASPGELNDLLTIQNAHDNWAKWSNKYGARTPATIAKRNAFLALIAA